MRTTPQSAFSLIEMIVALAVVAILLAVLAVSFVKREDRIAGEKETQALKRLAAAFLESAKRARHVPDHTTWATNVGTYLGWQEAAVTGNVRNLPRVLLIDPSMQISANNSTPLLPYTQTSSGSQILPYHPRFLLLSSIAKPLGLTSGLGASSGANAFANLWEGALPSGWAGRDAADLKTERVDLSELFVRVRLDNLSTTVPAYGIDNSTGNTIAANNFVIAYYLRGSELKLYTNVAASLPEYTEILYTSQNFVFEEGTWRGKTHVGRPIVEPTGEDMERAMNLFLRAPTNRFATATQRNVYDAMVRYMTNFIAWRDANYVGEGCPGPVANNAYTSTLRDARVNLSTVTGNLITPR